MAVAVQRGGRRGRWLVLGLLTVGLVALIAGIADLATQKPDRSRSRNAVRANSFFKIPPERVVELGMQVEL